MSRCIKFLKIIFIFSLVSDCFFFNLRERESVDQERERKTKVFNTLRFFTKLISFLFYTALYCIPSKGHPLIIIPFLAVTMWTIHHVKDFPVNN